MATPDLNGAGGHELPANSNGRLMGALDPVTNGVSINLNTLSLGHGDSIQDTSLRNRWSDDP